jgi:hypothetical protein
LVIQNKIREINKRMKNIVKNIYDFGYFDKWIVSKKEIDSFELLKLIEFDSNLINRLKSSVSALFKEKSLIKEKIRILKEELEKENDILKKEVAELVFYVSLG